MAKVSFAKLGLKVETEVENITFKDQVIEVKKYLPMELKMAMIGDIINQAADENRFYNPMKLDIFRAIEIISNYTNISFTDKQKEDPAKLYDQLITSGLYTAVLGAICADEWHAINNSLEETVKSIYSYQNSIFGILDDMSRDYSNLSLNAAEIQKQLSDPESLSLVKNILTKMG